MRVRYTYALSTNGHALVADVTLAFQVPRCDDASCDGIVFQSFRSAFHVGPRQSWTCCNTSATAMVYVGTLARELMSPVPTSMRNQGASVGSLDRMSAHCPQAGYSIAPGIYPPYQSVTSPSCKPLMTSMSSLEISKPPRSAFWMIRS